MSPGGQNRFRPAESASGPRAIFREEPDRLVLTNQALVLAFSRVAPGTIVSLYQHQTGTELVDPGEATAEGSLWQIRLISRTGSSASLSSRACEQFAHQVCSDGSGTVHLQLEWIGLKVGACQIGGWVVARFRLPATGGTVLAEIEFALPAGMTAAEVEFPRLTSLGASQPLAEESLFLPLSDGVLVPEPRGLLAGGKRRRWEANYPGAASLQLFGYTVGGRSTAWLSARDPNGSRKTLVAAAMPDSERMALWLAHSPRTDGEGRWSLGYDTTLSLALGDWYDAAREYRAWAVRQPWCARGRTGVERRPPVLTTMQGLWVSHWGDSRSALPVVRELVRAVNAPVRLDWRNWNQGPPPDYLPPRDGDLGFANAVRALAETGVYVQLGFDGLHASLQSEAWQQGEASRAALQSPVDGVVDICPGTAYWPKTLAAVAKQGAERGAEGIYLSGLGIADAAMCEDESHGHPSGDPAEWVNGVRRTLGEVRRAVGDSYQIATDGPSEAYLDLLDAFLVPHACAEGLTTLPNQFGSRWQPIPLFTAVYHQFCAEIGVGSALTNVRPHDSTLPASEAAALRQPEALMSRDYQGQFCVEIARAAVWGRQLMLSRFSPEQARDDRGRRKLAFLAAVLRAQTWGIGAFLTHADFLGPLSVEAPPIEVDFLVNRWDSDPERRRLLRRRLSPVLGGIWRAASGSLALALANVAETPVDFATQLPSARLGFTAPSQLIGRAFSEDGDAAAAKFRMAGNAMSGRLPARCLVLVTVR